MVSPYFPWFCRTLRGGGVHKICARRGVWKIVIGGGVHNPDPLRALVWVSSFISMPHSSIRFIRNPLNKAIENFIFKKIIYPPWLSHRDCWKGQVGDGNGVHRCDEGRVGRVAEGAGDEEGGGGEGQGDQGGPQQALQAPGLGIGLEEKGVEHGIYFFIANSYTFSYITRNLTPWTVVSRRNALVAATALPKVIVTLCLFSARWQRYWLQNKFTLPFYMWGALGKLY